MPAKDRIVAVGLLTVADLQALGDGFTRCFPVEAVPSFEELLSAIDDANRNLRKAQGLTDFATIVRIGPAQ